MPITRHPRPAIEALRSVSLFAGCTDKELGRIDRLTCPADVAAGTVLCRQGCFGTQTFIVVSGQAIVSVDGTEIAQLGPGSFFGEMSVLDGNRRVATVTAFMPMSLLVLTARELDQLLLDVPSVARRMLAAVGGRLRLADRAFAQAVIGLPNPATDPQPAWRSSAGLSIAFA
jgi:CRP/FNR family cyclic AMP-dependent transcriptional regulator